MDERFDQLAKRFAMPTGAAPGEGACPSLGDLSGVFGEPVSDEAITEDGVLYAKVVCHDQKRRGGSLSDAVAFVEMWHERFRRSNFYGCGLETMKSLVAKQWDSVNYPDPELQDQYYAMVARLFF